MHFSFKFGTSEFLARLPAALFGLFLLILIFYTGKIIYDAKTGVIATFLAAISGLLIAHAQEARMYPHFAFFSLLSLVFLFKILYERDKTVYWIIFILAATANLYTHTFATIVIAIEVLFAVSLLLIRIIINKDRSDNIYKLLKLLLCLLIIAILSSPEFLKKHNLIKQHIGGKKLSRGVKIEMSFFKKIFGQFTIPGYPVIIVIYIVTFLFGCIASLFRRPGRFFLVLLWIFLPIAILIIFKAKHFFNVRYIIFILPVYLICTAYGIKTLLSLISRSIKKLIPFLKRIDFILIFFLVLIIILIRINYPLYEKFYTAEKDNWKAAVKYVKEHANNDDLILADHGAWICFGYYMKINNMKNPLINNPTEISKTKPDNFWFVTVNTGPEIFPDDYKVTDMKRYRSYMVTSYYLQRFDWFQLKEFKLSSPIITSNELMNVTITFHNPDKNIPQIAVYWLSVEISQNNTRNKISDVSNIVILNPGETITKNVLIKTPSKAGEYTMVLTYSAPPHTFFPGSHRFYYQIGLLQKDFGSPSLFVINADRKYPPQGYLMYGPYTTFPDGNYKAFFLADAFSIGSKNDNCSMIDIISGGGKKVFGKKYLSANMFNKGDQYTIFQLDFFLEKETELEFRMMRLLKVDTKCAGIVLIQQNPDWGTDPKRRKTEKIVYFDVQE